MEILLRIVIACFLGIITGINRDNSWQEAFKPTISRFTFLKSGKSAFGMGGVRTHLLLALVGALLGISFAEHPELSFLSIIFSVGIVVLIAISYILNFIDKYTLGMTTEFATFGLFILAFLSGTGFIDFKVLLLIGIIMSLIMSLKIEVRSAISGFTKREILESLEFSAIALAIFPWLPDINFTIGKLAELISLDAGELTNIVILNPSKLWLVVVFISALNFVSYFAAKLFRSRGGVLFAGFLGGFVSSTSVTELMAMQSKTNTSNHNLLEATAVIANATSFLRIPIIVIAMNIPLFVNVIPSMAFMAFTAFVLSMFLSRGKDSEEISPVSLFKSPLAIKPALIFGVLFTLVQVFTQIGTLYLGKIGFAASTLISAISGMDAVTISTARAVPSLINIEFGGLVLTIAAVANLIFKAILAYFVGNPKFATKLILYFSIISIAGLFGLFI